MLELSRAFIVYTHLGEYKRNCFNGIYTICSPSVCGAGRLLLVTLCSIPIPALAQEINPSEIPTYLHSSHESKKKNTAPYIARAASRCDCVPGSAVLDEGSYCALHSPRAKICTYSTYHTYTPHAHRVGR